nr:Fc receptor-like protein 5 [Chelonoidis abingdonii]
MIQSLPSAPLSIHLTEPSVLPESFRPTLRLSPPGPEFTTGESVTLTCSAPIWEKKMGFCFLKAGEQVACTRQALEDSQSYQIGRLGMEDSGSYTCMYRVAEPGQEISSLESQLISITVTAPPLAPKLSLHPKLLVYMPGEKITLNCSAPHGEEVSGFRFHHQRGDQTPEELPAAIGGPWMDLTAQTGNDGSYTCQYWRREAGQEIVSKNSNSITVPVSARAEWDPTSGVVSEGLPLLITCMAPEDANKWRFHFYKDAVELLPRDVGSEISTMEHGTAFMNVSVLGIPWAGPESTGEFTCGYEENMSGRWIPSPRSWAVNVTSGSIQGAVLAETQPLYVNRPSSTGTVLQQRSHDGQVQPVTHNHPAPPNDPGGKPRVGRNPQERGKREEDADARVECNSLVSNPVYSMLTPSSAVAQQRGGKYISEAVVYSEIPY